jgi:CDP-diacylglycerol--glycerol-3-phosphate 3-phosphatidyltransferase
MTQRRGEPEQGKRTVSTSAKDSPASHVTTTSAEVRSVVFNLPNQLTWMRLILTTVMFVFLSFEWYLVSMVMFIVAASTDWLDGYFARRYNLVTTLGRILDPFADKVIICGTFILLAAVPQFNGFDPRYYGYLPAWMAVVVVGRELLVTALRSFLEQQGSDFSASMSGKVKMVLQCVAAGSSLYYLSTLAGTTPAESTTLQTAPPWLHWLLLGAIWSAVISTIYSGVGYILTAIRLLRG